MTVPLIVLIIGLLAVTALLWCLAGFSRALKEKPKVIGWLVRAGINPASMKQRKAVVIAFPECSAPTQQVGAARVRNRSSVNLLMLAGSATLLSLSAGFHFISTI
jgi:hypothetical protein